MLQKRKTYNETREIKDQEESKLQKTKTMVV